VEARLENNIDRLGGLERNVASGLVDEQQMITTTSVGDVAQRVGVSVLCKKAPLGYERLQGDKGILFANPLPDTTFFLSVSGITLTIKNATEWEFEKASSSEPSPARASGYVQVNDVFLWGQRVRCKQSPAHYASNAVGVEGTLQPLHVGDAKLVATFHGDNDRSWPVFREGWEFEKVIAGDTSGRSDWVTALLRLRALIGSKQRIVRSPWPGCIDQETVIEEVQNCMSLGTGAVVSFEVYHDGDVRRCGIGETNWRHWKFEPVAAHPPTDDKTFDVVDHPKHYNVHPSGVECIEIMERLGSNLGSAFKYIWRADEKHDTPLTDLKKALWYLRSELDIKWEPSTVTQERVKRVVSHESFNTGSAMLAIFNAANSENGSVDKRAVIETAIESIEAELRRLSK